MFSRLIDGKFPDYHKAIPVGNDKAIVIDRVKLFEIVRRKSVLSSDKSKLVRLSFSPGEMVVVLKNAERGESIDKLAIDYEMEAVDVGFNVDYLLEYLKNMSVEKIEINIKDHASQGLFQLVNEEDTGLDYKHIIMPMRLTG